MTVTPSALSLTRLQVIPCREYERINVAAAEVLGPGGKLTILPNILGHYVTADFAGAEVRLSAKGVSGLVPLTDNIAVQVRPRFPLTNLTRMVNACGYAPMALPALRDYLPSDDPTDWLRDVLAESLLDGLDVIMLNGLLRTYRRRTEVSSYPHGRIDITTTVMRYAARGVRHQAQYSWFERTVDNPPNRCLKSAVAALYFWYLNAPHGPETRLRVARLGHAMRTLREVSTETRPTSLNDAEVRGDRPLPATRAYYRPVLDVAVAILTSRGISLDATGGGVSLPSLLVKTEDLFENYVRLTLQRAFSVDQQVAVLDGNKNPGRVLLYEEVPSQRSASLPPHVSLSDRESKPPSAEPDIVFRATDGSHPLVADVKYTKVTGHTKRDEVEQAFLYAVRYGSPIAMTIHPKLSGSTKGLHLSGRIGSVLVMQYRVDLGAEDLEIEMLDMAEVLKELIGAATVSAR